MEKRGRALTCVLTVIGASTAPIAWADGWPEVIVTAPRFETIQAVFAGQPDIPESLDGSSIDLAAPQRPPTTSLQDVGRPRLNTGTEDVVLLVPVRESGPLGQVEIRITPSDEVLVSVRDMVRVLERTIVATSVIAIQSTASNEGYASLDRLRAAGLGIQFDASALELVLGIEAGSRLARRIPLGFESGLSDVRPDISSRFAVALNYQGTLDYEFEEPRRGIRGPRLNLDLDGRIRPIAFENEFTFDSDEARAFSRQASRLIFDQPGKSLRWTAGDLVPAGTSFQGGVEIAGVGLSRLTQTYRSGRSLLASSSRSLTLQAPARVEIFVNGQPSRVIQLGPGTFDLTDLPLTTGASNVQIVVEDEAGDRQVINYDFFSDFSLLAPGLSEFDFQIGISAPLLTDERDYQTDRPVATGFYRRGITDRFTAGANFQLAEFAQQVGVEGALGSRFGLFNAEFAVSESDDVGSGYAGRLEYLYTKEIPELSDSRRFNLSIERRSEDFGGLEVFRQSSTNGWLVSARYDQPIRPDLSMFAGVDYTESRDAARDDQYGASAGLSWNYDPSTSINGRISYTNQSFAGRDEVTFGIVATRRFGFTANANAAYESADNSFQLGYSRGPGLSARGIAYNAQLSRQNEAFGLNASATYVGGRADLGVAHSTAFDRDGEVASQRSSIRASGAIAYADGRVAIGPRVSGAFAIIDTHPTLGDAAVVIGTRFSDREIVRSGPLGPALVSLSSYSPQTIPFNVPDAPVGYDLGEGVFEVYPWEHAGYAFEVGSAYNVTALGYLLDAGGEPVVLKSGVARCLTDADAPPQQMFTNRTGRFGISGLSVGRWRVTMIDGLIYEFDIGEDQGALVRLGSIRPVSGSEGQ